MKRLVGSMALAVLVLGGTAQAQVSVKIGVLSDMSSLYSDLGGAGSTLAAKMAVEDFGAAQKGLKVEIVSADHQNKIDIGVSVARRWLDVEKVDAIVDVPSSGIAIAVSHVVREKNKVLLVSGAASSELTGAQCSPDTVHWTYDTWALAHGTGTAVVKNGGDAWFFLTADYAFGQALERDTTAVVNANGGRVLGAVRHPLNTSDFSSFLLQAQASRAKIIGLANAGGDAVNTIKQAAEFGITQGGQNLAGLLVFISDVNALGLATAQGLYLTEAWYWDMNDGSRAFAKRFAAANNGKYPTMVQAGVYSAVTHYLKAVLALRSAVDGKAVVAAMKGMSTDDPLFGKGTIRADGRKIHDMYLFEVKKPAESRYPWDYYKLRATIPAAQAFRPLNEGGCSTRDWPAIAAAPNQTAPIQMATAPAALAPPAAAPVGVTPPAATPSQVMPPAIAVPSVAAVPADAGRRVALVIGNSSYQAVAALPNPRRDAEAMAAVLRGVGFQTVTLVNDLGHEKLVAALRAFAREADNADWALIYFAGHGLEMGGVNYLIPVDAKLETDRDVQYEAVALEQVLGSVEGAKKLRLVLLDACRENPFARQMRRTVASRSIGRGLARIEPDGGTLVAYAAKDGQIALDGDGTNSPFVAALVKRLPTPGVEIGKLFRQVRDDVMQTTGRKQEPYVYGALPGEDFFFVAAK